MLSTVNGGWPGGTYITYRLSDGPAAGLVVYAAEDIEPLVQAGESVTPNTVLGTVYEGPDGIETGWADNGTGDTMARDASQFYGWNSTAFGANFSELLVSLELLGASRRMTRSPVWCHRTGRPGESTGGEDGCTHGCEKPVALLALG